MGQKWSLCKYFFFFSPQNPSIWMGGCRGDLQWVNPFFRPFNQVFFLTMGLERGGTVARWLMLSLCSNEVYYQTCWTVRTLRARPQGAPVSSSKTIDTGGRLKTQCVVCLSVYIDTYMSCKCIQYILWWTGQLYPDSWPMHPGNACLGP